MRILALDRRAIGQRLICDVVDESGRVLLGAGATITDRYRTLLQGRGYTSVPVDGLLAQDVVPTEPVPPRLRQHLTEVVGQSFHRAHRGTTASGLVGPTQGTRSSLRKVAPGASMVLAADAPVGGVPQEKQGGGNGGHAADM